MLICECNSFRNLYNILPKNEWKNTYKIGTKFLEKDIAKL